MFRVVVTDYLKPPAVHEERELSGLASVECAGATSPAELEGKVESADGLLVFHDISIPAETIDRLDRCRLIVRVGVGFDNVDLAAAGRRGIYVCNVPDYGVDEVADHAIGMLLACNRGLMLVERRLRATLNPWDYHSVEPVFRLAGATIGIVGLGRIGTATALRARALRMHVIFYDPYVPDGRDKALGFERVEMDELLARSDVVSLHTPLTDETRGMIGADQLASMKPRAILINTARGAVVDVDALAEALSDDRIAGAGIDVLPQEPARPGHKLIQLWQDDRDPPVNLVITPHTAFYSEAGLVEMRTKAAREVARVLRGRKPRNPVNLEFMAGPT